MLDKYYNIQCPHLTIYTVKKKTLKQCFNVSMFPAEKELKSSWRGSWQDKRPIKGQQQQNWARSAKNT